METDTGKTILITGATGFIGQALSAALRGRGDRVIAVARRPEQARQTLETSGASAGDMPGALEVIEGDTGMEGDWQQHIAKADAVVHLAGESVAGKRWNAQFKQRLRDSRVEGARCISEAIGALAVDARPDVFITASGVDFYAPADEWDSDAEIDESAPVGESFLARVCREWEAEALASTEHGVRVVCMRTGVVLGPGGALTQMALPFRMFAGGPIGNGRQWLSWVHLDDAVAAYLFAIDGAIDGPINLVAPNPVSNKDFSRALGKALHRPSWMPVPAFALRAAVGEFAQYLLHGRRAIPAALLNAGYVFRYPELAAALADVYQS